MQITKFTNQIGHFFIIAYTTNVLIADKTNNVGNIHNIYIYSFKRFS